MPNIPYSSARNAEGGAAFAASTYTQISGNVLTSGGTEAQSHLYLRTGAGTFTKLRCFIISNTSALDSTVKFVVNGTDVNQVATITALTSGEFEDSSNSDLAATDDDVCYHAATGDGLSGVVWSFVSSVCAATSTLIQRYVSNLNNLAASGTDYPSLNHAAQTATEANGQHQFKIAGSFKNLYVTIPSNTTSANSTFKSQIDGANGNLIITIAGAATGEFEDTSNSDSISVDTKVGIERIAGSGGTLGGQTCSSMFQPTDGLTCQMIGGGTGGIAVNTTVKFSIAGGTFNTITTEARTQQKITATYTASKLNCYVTANASTTSSFVKSRIGGMDGSLVVTITASTTGWFEDTSNSDSLVSGNYLAFSAVAGDNTTTISSWGYLMANPSTPAPAPSVTVVTKPKLKTLLGVGL